MLLLRDTLVQLVPPGSETSLAAGQPGGAWPGCAAELAAVHPGAAAAGGGGQATPSSWREEQQPHQLPLLRRDGGTPDGPPPCALPSIFFKATAVIGEALVVCESGLQVAGQAGQQSTEMLARVGCPQRTRTQLLSSVCLPSLS